MMVDPRVAQAIAAGRVPKEFTAEYLSESRDESSIVAIVFVAALTFIIVISRLLSRALIVRHIGFDDGLALLSLICLIGFAGLSIEIIRLGSGRHFPFIRWVLTVPTVLKTQVLDFIAHLLYTTALLLCRMSGLALYHRICGTHDKFRLAIKFVFGILIAGYLPQMLVLIFHCKPVTMYWPYGWEPLADKYKCLEWSVVYSVNSSVSLVCDFLLFGIPIAMLKMLEMPRKRKVQLACILLPGIVVVAISLTRLVFVIPSGWQLPDESWWYNPMLGVEVSEIGATLIALSVPGVKPLVDALVFGKHESQAENLPKYERKSTSLRSRGTPLSTLNFSSHTRHSTLASRDDNTVRFGAEATASSENQHTNDSTDGIYVRMDFRVETDAPASVESR
ncbi:hypothetical protein PT974_01874 [Cladobotryum mycophilum]|uniref:Rhodopsin domain-containing protein n=1 Tax=Cladobotryum mycophilum TaxID=491253 RepID=A0ABR0SWN6_9HYPO